MATRVRWLGLGDVTVVRVCCSGSGETLESEHYAERVLSGLHMLQQNTLLCDVTLVIGDTHISDAHRAVLAASSEYFRACFTIDMQEKSQRVISLKGVPERGLRELIKFAYTGHLYCSFDNISDVLLAASHLQFNEAVHLCCHYLMSQTTVNNCVDMYNMAEQFTLTRLRDKSLNLILKNFQDIAARNEFVYFQHKFLMRILADNRLNVMTELQLFNIVLAWINHNPEERMQFTYQLMSQVRFPLIPATDLVDKVMVAPLMKSDPQCLELLLEANKYHMLPEKQPQMQTRRSQVRSDLASLVVMEEGRSSVLDLTRRTWHDLVTCHIDTYHSQLCVLDNYMYVCGGMEVFSSNNPVSAKCYRFDPRFNTWAEVGAMQQPRHHFTLVSDNRYIWAVGGYSGGQNRNVLEQYIVREDRWILRTPLDVRLSSAAGAAHDGKIYISGGQSDMGPSRCLWCYNTATDSWCSRAPMIHSRMDHAMCCYAKRLYVLGGYDKNIIKAFDVDNVEMYNTETNQWSKVCDNTPKVSGVYSCLIESCVYLVGGFTYDDNKKRNEVWSFNIKTNEWQVVTRISSPAMSVPCCALYTPRLTTHQATV